MSYCGPTIQPRHHDRTTARDLSWVNIRDQPIHISLIWAVVLARREPAYLWRTEVLKGSPDMGQWFDKPPPNLDV